MEQDDPFSKSLRGARDRIAELQRRSGAKPGGGLLLEALAELDVAIEALSVTGAELREQTHELTSTRMVLETERQRYQELFDAAPVAYLVTDPVARVLEANRAAAALLGVAQGFLAGKPLAAYVDGSDRWGFRSMVNRLRGGEDERVTDRPLRFRRRGGEVVTALATVEPVRDSVGGQAALRWVLRGPEGMEPVHPALPVEQAVAQDGARRRHLAALEGLDPTADLDGTVQVVDAGVRLLGVDGIGLMLADTQGRLCTAGASDEAVLGFLRAQEHAVKGPCVHAFLLERTVQARSLTVDPRWPALAEAAAVHAVDAALATPIGLYGGPIGAVLLALSSPRTAWTDGDVTAAQAYASVLAALLELAAEAQRGAGPSQRPKDLLQAQVVVEQAKGALMARRGIDADAAALQLRQLARRSGRPLAEVAASLLRRLGAGAS